ncbi:MAG: RluA family pseudouridine synthase [bacterium]|nr:RluA family pseudouridine synthase [bacterium]
MSEPTTRFQVGRREQGKRLDRFLHGRIPGLSRTRIQRAIKERVELSWGVRARPSTPVQAGGTVSIGYTPLVEELLEIEIPVLVRGPGWLAVNKPSGVPVHPVNRIRENSLIRMLRRQERHAELRLTHRLDAETTGVLLIAENRETARSLSLSFMRGLVHKEYLAVVRGVVERDSGNIDLAIGPARDSQVYVRLEAGHGRESSTAWKVERRFADRTLLRLFPRTGRRHQLRVHLEAIGHPILGDLLYGRDDGPYLRLVRGEGDARADDDGPSRQLLHCARLEFPDPSGEGTRTVQAALPSDFEGHEQE